MWLVALKFSILNFGLTISLRRLVAITVVASGTFAWFFVFENNFGFLFQNVTSNDFVVAVGNALFLGFGAFSAVIGSMLSRKVSRRKLFWSTIGLGVLATGSLLAVHGEFLALLVSSILGISLGLGFPSSVALLGDYTDIEERGRASGVLMFEAFVLAIIASSLILLLNLGLIEVVLLCVILRSTSLLGLTLDPLDKKKEKEKSWMSVLKDRDSSFYFIPWVIFAVAAYMIGIVFVALPNIQIYTLAENTGGVLIFVGGAVFSLISGFLADRFGRKLPIIIGVIIFVVSSVILGLATSPLGVVIEYTTVGIAWYGFLFVAYIAVSGDLAVRHSQERYYVLFTALLLAALAAGQTYLAPIWVLPPESVLARVYSPILSVLLLLSVVSILYASETLSETKIRSRRMREYLQKVEKVVDESKKADKR